MSNQYTNYLINDAIIEKYFYKNDKKYHIFKDGTCKILNVSHGYGFDLKTSYIEYDYSFSELRCKYFFDDCILTTSFEDKNPYAEVNKYSSLSGKEGWKVYADEWIFRYITHPDFLKSNNITKVKETINDDNFLGKYELVKLSYFINDSEKITNPYYNIAVIREKEDYKNFYLFVMKSTIDKSDDFIDIINSFVLFEKVGSARNVSETYKVNKNPRWNNMTKKYFNKLLKQQSVDWGIFTKSLTDETDGAFEYIENYYKNNGDRCQFFICCLNFF